MERRLKMLSFPCGSLLEKFDPVAVVPCVVFGHGEAGEKFGHGHDAFSFCGALLILMGL